ncbi:MAG TPA: molecular chaperone TorD family protein [Verrucomicrobiae bacterium]|nr:molecular chaperone TorD family protein [Verrucomicrobiae bacterium]
MARSFVYRFLAKAYEDPMPASWGWLTNSQTINLLRMANTFVGIPVLTSAERLIRALHPGDYQSYCNAYLSTFGHAARGSCPLNEIEYGDIKADPLFQPHRLADLAAFYRAFGLEVAEDAGERHDHLCLELEFMCVLAAKEAYAHEHQLDADQLAQCRDVQKAFLREHLGRWTPAFTRRLAAATTQPTLHGLAEFTRAFVESECARFGVNAGSEELALRPVDEIADRMCDSCGINNLPPGALAAT